MGTASAPGLRQAPDNWEYLLDRDRTLAIGQLGYNGSKIVTALKTQSYQLGLATIIRAFCCGIAAFLLKSKYDKVLVTYGQRPPGPDSDTDMEAGGSQDNQQDEGWALHSDDEHQDRRKP